MYIVRDSCGEAVRETISYHVFMRCFRNRNFPQQIFQIAFIVAQVHSSSQPLHSIAVGVLVGSGMNVDRSYTLVSPMFFTIDCLKVLYLHEVVHFPP